MSILLNILLVCSMLAQGLGVLAAGNQMPTPDNRETVDESSFNNEPRIPEEMNSLSSDEWLDLDGKQAELLLLDSVSALPPFPREDTDPVVISLSIDEEIVTLGDVLTFTVTITNNTDGALYDLIYEDVLEDGLNFVKGEDDVVTFDPSTKTISYELPYMELGLRVDFSYSVRVLGTLPQDRPWGELWIHEVAFRIDDPGMAFKTQGEMWYVRPDQKKTGSVQHVQPDGGWSKVGPAAVYLPSTALGTDAMFVVTPSQYPGNGPEFQFQVDLYEIDPIVVNAENEIIEQKVKVNNKREQKFAGSAYMRVDFEEISDLDDSPAGKIPYVVTYDEEADVWVKVPVVEVDYKRNHVIIGTVQFSTWGAGMGDSLPQNGANVLVFDEPQVSLFTGRSRFSYPIWSPPGRAGMGPFVSLSYTSGTVDGVLGDIQAPWVGMGWSIDGIEIVRKITTDENGYGYENEFALTINGTKYELVEDEDIDGCYHTKDASFLYVQRHNPALGNDGSVSNDTSEWWEVRATDGTRYRLGWTDESEQLALMDGYSCTDGDPCDTPNGAYASLGYAGTGVDVVDLRWRVDRIEDLYGNYIEYTYDEETSDVGFATFDHASYLENIKYTGFTDPQEVQDLDPGYCIYFDTDTRDGDNPAEDLEIWDNYDTYQLEMIKIYYGACESGTLVRTYELGYEVHTVPSLDGSLVLTSIKTSSIQITEGSITMDAATAPTIEFSYTDLPNQKETCASCEKWPYPRLEEIDNGYSATQEFTYEKDTRGEDYWYNYRVTDAEVDNGIDTASIRGYTYTTPVYEGIGEDEDAGSLIGYTYVTETSYEFNGTTKILDVQHYFGTMEPEEGKEYWVKWKESDGTELRKVEYTWKTDNSQMPTDVTFLYLGQESYYERIDSSLELLTKTVYDRDPFTGSLRERREYIGTDLYRYWEYEYEQNDDPDVWLLGLVTRQTLKDSGHNLLADSRYEYDGGAATITLGELTTTQVLTGNSTETADTEFEYNSYGNLRKTYIYETYGIAGTSPSGDSQLTEVTYDNTLHTYPVTLVNAEGETTTTDYLFTLGLPYRVKDLNYQASYPNEWRTLTSYDGLGRVVDSTAPDFAVATTKFTYSEPDDNGDVDAPYYIKLEVRDTLGPSAPVYRSSWAFYDGLGRVIQNQIYDADSSKYITTDVEFNAQGSIYRESIPRAVSGTAGTYQNPTWVSLDYTEVTYDTLGRVTQVTDPANRSAETSYAGLVTSVVDPNGHKISQEVDALGRLIRVNEYTGEDPSWTLYSTTTYSYNAADLLVKVKDTRGNDTTMDYDWLGRKIAMDDPDMGDWDYEYNPTGTLSEQTDARNQVISFEYDELNRLTKKRDMDTPIDIANYTYGTAAGEKGFRKTMVDDTGTTTWTYSNNGRTVVETRTIDSVNYSFTTVYDWLGRVDTITYPDTEVVEYEYDALGRASSLSAGQDTDLVTLTYNTLGQVEETDLDNGILIQNCYDAAGDTYNLLSRRAYSGSAQSCSIQKPSGAEINFAYTYDSVGNITTLQDFVRGESFDFTYDDLDRLTVAEGTSPTDIAYRHAYSYDQIGNIVQVNEWDGDHAGTGTYEEDHYRFWFEGSWSEVTDAGASGGAYNESSQEDDVVRLAFTGVGFNYTRNIGPDQGIAYIYLDGSFLAQVDNYAASTSMQQDAHFTATSGDHLLEIVVSGEKNASSSGTEISLDAVEVLASGATPTPTNTTTSTPSPTPSETPTATTSPSGTINARVSSSSDDVEEKASDGTVYLDSSDLELGDDTDWYGDHTIGLRIQNLAIPQGATISDAYLEFETDETGDSTTNIEIWAQDADNAAAFTTTAYNLTDRTKTTASALWSIPAWNQVSETHQSPDLSLVLQEVVDRVGWSSGNSMVFIISGTGTRTAESYDGESAAAPLLHVEYYAVTPTPTLTATPSPSSTNTLTPTPTNTPTPSPLLSNLVSYWKLDETNGTRDDVHGANDLSDGNTAGYSTGVLENAVDFVRTSSEYLSHTDNADLSTGDIDFTIALWVKLDGTSTFMACGSKAASINTGEWFFVYDTSAGNKWRFYVKSQTDGWKYAQWETSPSASEWYYIVGWHDAISNKMYLQVNNGTPVFTSLTNGPVDTTSIFALGRRYSENYWDGAIDEIGFWKRILSSDERTYLYNSGNGKAYPFSDFGPPGEGTYQEDANIFRYTGDWDDDSHASYSNGQERIADSAGEEVSFTFDGNSFTYYRYVGPNRGIIEICVDGEGPEVCTDVDNYAATAAYQQSESFVEPADQYEITLRYTGRKHTDSTGFLVSLDKIVVEDLPPTPTPTLTPSPTPDSILLDDLVSYWKLDETSGTRDDAHGDNDLSDGNTVGYRTGKISNAADLVSGNSEYLNHADNSDLSIEGTDFTFAGWVYRDGTGYWDTPWAKRTSSNIEYQLTWVGGTNYLRWYVGDGNNYQEKTVTSAGWHFVVAWYDVDTNTSYLSIDDDTAGTKACNDPVATSGQMSIGRNPTGSGYMDGAVDEVGFWKRILTADERTYLYNNGSGRTYHFTYYPWTPTPSATPTATATATPLEWPTQITQTPTQPAGTYENTDSAWYYIGDWTQVDDAGDSGGSRKEADIPWSGAQLSFSGNGIDFVYREKSSYGIAEIFVDGNKKASVDQYNDTETAGQSIHVTLLNNGPHVLEIRRADRKNVDSSGYVINLDKVVVYSASTPTATLTPTVTNTPTSTLTPSPTPTYAQITVGDTVSTHSECTSSIDFDHTVDEGDDRVLIVTLVYRRNSGQSLWSVKYNDVSLTKVAERGDPGGDEAIVHMWYLANPPVGTYEVDVGHSNTCIVAGAYNLYGVDVTDPVVDYDTTITWTGPVSLDLDSSAGDMGVDVVGIDGTSGRTPGDGQTEQWDLSMSGSGWGMGGASSTEGATDISVTMSYSFVHEREGAYVAAVFRARQDPYPTSTPTGTPAPTATPTEQTGWEYAYYTYESSQPHAVATIARSGGNDTFGYDNIGNMTSRTEGGTAYTQVFNAEGRLKTVTVSGDTWTFKYDGDGNRVIQENPGGTTTLFLGGGAYEVLIDGQSSTVTKYYAIAGQRVMCDSSGLHYLLTDHLGSVVAVLDGSGDLETDERYLPFGGLRDSTGISETDFAFTGQRNLSDVGLMDYNARWYLSSVGRFISADPIVPEPGNPQTLNRYGYVSNNPTRFTDPSGYRMCDGQYGECDGHPRLGYGGNYASLIPRPKIYDWCTPSGNSECLESGDSLEIMITHTIMGEGGSQYGIQTALNVFQTMMNKAFLWWTNYHPVYPEIDTSWINPRNRAWDDITSDELAALLVYVISLSTSRAVNDRPDYDAWERAQDHQGTVWDPVVGIVETVLQNPGVDPSMALVGIHDRYNPYLKIRNNPAVRFYVFSEDPLTFSKSSGFTVAEVYKDQNDDITGYHYYGTQYGLLGNTID